jgi:hypothetical protein
MRTATCFAGLLLATSAFHAEALVIGSGGRTTVIQGVRAGSENLPAPPGYTGNTNVGTMTAEEWQALLHARSAYAAKVKAASARVGRKCSSFPSAGGNLPSCAVGP